MAATDVVPAAFVGHSSGEIAAAYVAGALTEAEAIIAALHRGQAAKSKSSGPGAMVSVRLSRTSLENITLHGATLACDNSPVNVTLSGSKAEVDAAVDVIEDLYSGCLLRGLKVTRAYYSALMHTAGKLYEEMLTGRIRGTSARVSYFSALLGRKLEASETMDPVYWRQHLLS